MGIYFQNTGEFSLINWLILTSLFWFDATYTLFRRWRNKEQLSVAHRKHAYQRIVQAGWSHQKTTFTGSFLNMILLLLTFISFHNQTWQLLFLLAAVVILFAATYFVDRKKAFEKNQAL